MSPLHHDRKSLHMGLDTYMSNTQIHPAGNRVGMGDTCMVDSSSWLPTEQSELSLEIN